MNIAYSCDISAYRYWGSNLAIPVQLFLLVPHGNSWSWPILWQVVVPVEVLTYFIWISSLLYEYSQSAWNRMENVYIVYVSCLACLLCCSSYYPWLLSIRALSRHFVFLSSTVPLSFWFCLISSACFINCAVPWWNTVFCVRISYVVRYPTSVITMLRCV